MKRLLILILLIGIVLFSGCVTEVEDYNITLIENETIYNPDYMDNISLKEIQSYVNLSIDNLQETESLTFSLDFFSQENVNNLSVSLILPEYFELVNGNISWESNLSKNHLVRISGNIRVNETGGYQIKAVSVVPEDLDLSMCLMIEKHVVFIYNETEMEENISESLTSTVPMAGAIYIFKSGDCRCSKNRHCNDDEYCLFFTCQPIECEYCQHIVNYQCVDYECCNDSECGMNEECKENVCIGKINNFYNKIAFNLGGDLYVMNLDGSNKTRIATCDGGYNYPSWSPDGEKIAFCNINIVNFDGSNKTKRIQGAHPKWSNDSKYIIYVDGDEIKKININNLSIDTLLSRCQPSEPAFSPDGSKIAYIIFDCKMEYYRGIFISNSDGSNESFLMWGAAPSWSPDGEKIVYVKESDNRFLGGIHITNIDGNNDTFITTGRYPSFSPDGKKILFDNGNGIYMINVDGTNQVKISDIGVYPTWSPLNENIGGIQ